VDYNRIFKKIFGKGSHRIRASLATYLISQDVGIKDIADLLGHENVASTMKYAAVIKTRIKDIHTHKNPFSI
jgi:site-specific recombinase XerD